MLLYLLATKSTFMDYQQPPVPPSSPSSSLFQLNLDAQNSYTLRSAASWAKVLGVVGIIIGILSIGAGILVQNAISQTGGRYYEDTGYNSRMVGNMGMIVYLVIGLIMIVSSIFAIGFGNKIGRALKTNDQFSLSGGFAAARNYFAFWAIILIILLILSLISVASLIGR